ncbi:response regulator receiver protein [Salinarchaeum sp. Harcht-Bsk1]|uniref:response regulator n=1 Tax=Salinarchaeum sp. Harcht-Bsk1 TaxID=1333523 RepID=UPI0003423839|nr:response regulator [Salinarchaeum sp. Harcht-Bsk1]AGN00857.1 response regulator receiver protein [Salinarchaeum sp. Harcht-Bsk1]
MDDQQDADTGAADRPRVLIVDDEREVADAYALRLRDVADVETAYGGQAALDTVADGTFDVVLLDRHMPGTSGDEVLDELQDAAFRGRVVMVTAIDPGFDVLDMPFDDYLCKPVDREDLVAAVDQQCSILGHELLGDYFGTEAKRRVIAAEFPEEERRSHERYGELETRVEALRRRVGRLLDDPSDLLSSFDDVGRTDE